LFRINRTRIIVELRDNAMKERIGHYRIVSELGRGGMGVVYKAHEESLNRFVAIKVLGSHVAEDPSYVQRFVREAQSAARLNHPNIVQIYSISEDDGQHFFVMEYVSGTSLQQIIKTEGKIDITRAETIVLQAAAGLQAAHEQGIIHRDIKPANLMIDNRGLVKIADFGLALPMGATARLTATGMVMGSPGYLSPEQCKNEGVDHRTDIYSLGVTLFEALTGRIPFEADSPLALIRQIVDVEPPDVCQLNPEVSDATRAILSRMMAKDPADRYADCSQLIADLQQDLLDRGVASRELPPSAAAVAPPPSKGSAVGIHESPTVAVDSGSAPEPVLPEPPPAPAEPVPASSEPTAAPVADLAAPPAPKRPLALIALVLLVFAAAALAGGGILLWKSGVVQRLAERRHRQEVAQQHDLSAETTGQEDASGVPPDEETAETAGAGGADEPSSPAATSAVPSTGAEAGAKAAVAPVRPTVPAPRSEPADRRVPDRHTEQPAEVVPAPDGAALIAVGENLLVGEVQTYLEDAMRRKGITVVDASAVPEVSELASGEQSAVRGALRSALRPYARHLVLARAEYLGERPLQYMGRSEVAFQARLSVAVIDLDDGRMVVQPFRKRVEYTHLNVDRVVAEALRSWTREAAAEIEPR